MNEAFKPNYTTQIIFPCKENIFEQHWNASECINAVPSVWQIGHWTGRRWLFVPALPHVQGDLLYHSTLSAKQEKCKNTFLFHLLFFLAAICTTLFNIRPQVGTPQEMALCSGTCDTFFLHLSCLAESVVGQRRSHWACGYIYVTTVWTKSRLLWSANLRPNIELFRAYGINTNECINTFTSLALFTWVKKHGLQCKQV